MSLQPRRGLAEFFAKTHPHDLWTMAVRAQPGTRNRKSHDIRYKTRAGAFEPIRRVDSPHCPTLACNRAPYVFSLSGFSPCVKLLGTSG